MKTPAYEWLSTLPPEAQNDIISAALHIREEQALGTAKNLYEDPSVSLDWVKEQFAQTKKAVPIIKEIRKRYALGLREAKELFDMVTQ